MNKSYVEFAVWAAIIIAVTLLGRWAFSVDTYAQEGGGSTPTVTPTSLGEEGDGDEQEKRENYPDCEEPFNEDHPSCSGYIPMADRTATAEARRTATAEARRTVTADARRTATAEARRTATADARRPQPAKPTVWPQWRSSTPDKPPSPQIEPPQRLP